MTGVVTDAVGTSMVGMMSDVVELLVILLRSLAHSGIHAQLLVASGIRAQLLLGCHRPLQQALEQGLETLRPSCLASRSKARSDHAGGYWILPLLVGILEAW
jgi:hypothetical protein